MAEAARRLGRSESAVRNWLDAGTLLGERGSQPVRPRWTVSVDATGAPLTPDGPHPLFQAARISSSPTEQAALVARVEALEDSVRTASGDGSVELGSVQAIGAVLRSTLELQQQAARLHAEALKDLSEALQMQEALLGQVLGQNSPADAATS